MRLSIGLTSTCSNAATTTPEAAVVDSTGPMPTCAVRIRSRWMEGLTHPGSQIKIDTSTERPTRVSTVRLAISLCLSFLSMGLSTAHRRRGLCRVALQGAFQMNNACINNRLSGSIKSGNVRF